MPHHSRARAWLGLGAACFAVGVMLGVAMDRGTIVDGIESVDEVSERIFRSMLQTPSGRQTKSERHGYGQNEFVPWQLGRDLRVRATIRPTELLTLLQSSSSSLS